MGLLFSRKRLQCRSEGVGATGFCDGILETGSCPQNTLNWHGRDEADVDGVIVVWIATSCTTYINRFKDVADPQDFPSVSRFLQYPFAFAVYFTTHVVENTFWPANCPI